MSPSVDPGGCRVTFGSLPDRISARSEMSVSSSLADSFSAASNKSFMADPVPMMSEWNRDSNGHGSASLLSLSLAVNSRFTRGSAGRHPCAFSRERGSFLVHGYSV